MRAMIITVMNKCEQIYICPQRYDRRSKAPIYHSKRITPHHIPNQHAKVCRDIILIKHNKRLSQCAQLHSHANIQLNYPFDLSLLLYHHHHHLMRSLSTYIIQLRRNASRFFRHVSETRQASTRNRVASHHYSVSVLSNKMIIALVVGFFVSILFTDMRLLCVGDCWKLNIMICE